MKDFGQGLIILPFTPSNKINQELLVILPQPFTTFTTNPFIGISLAHTPGQGPLWTGTFLTREALSLLSRSVICGFDGGNDARQSRVVSAAASVGCISRVVVSGGFRSETGSMFTNWQLESTNSTPQQRSHSATQGRPAEVRTFTQLL